MYEGEALTSIPPDMRNTMPFTKPFLILATAGALALTGCTDATTGDPNRTGTGALIGAGLGGLLGSRADDDKGASILAGAAIGAAAGGVIGNILDRQAAELNRDLGGEIDVIRQGDALIVRMPNDILFAVDSAAVNPGLRSDLRTLSASLNKYPNTSVQIVGHADSDGTAIYNQDLSERRAQSVAIELIQGGVSSNRLQTFGRGESDPIATNLTSEGKAQNRRVDITIREF